MTLKNIQKKTTQLYNKMKLNKMKNLLEKLKIILKIKKKIVFLVINFKKMFLKFQRIMKLYKKNRLNKSYHFQKKLKNNLKFQKLKINQKNIFKMFLKKYINI